LFSPSAVGWAKDYTGSFGGDLYELAGFALMSAIVAALGCVSPIRRRGVKSPA
jgi:hypothetical protein